MENESIIYTNRFSIVTDAAKNEFIITFYQDIPKLDENYTLSKVDTTKVGTFVMNRAMFTSMLSQFNQILNSGENKSEDKNKSENV